MADDKPPGMSEDDLLKLYLSKHEAEFKWRDSINGSLTPFIGVLTLLVGAGLFYSKNATPFVVGCWYWVFLALLGFAGVALIGAIAYISQALWGHVYEYLTVPTAIETWRTANAEYHALHPDERPSLAERLRNDIIAQVAFVASANRATNRMKSEKAYAARAWTIAALVFLALDLIPYSILTRTATLAPQVSIVPVSVPLPSKASDHVTEEPKKISRPSTSGPAATPAQPAKTSFPPPESIREGNEKPPRGVPINERKKP
jgi:hypothetical protein